MGRSSLGTELSDYDELEEITEEGYAENRRMAGYGIWWEAILYVTSVTRKPSGHDFNYWIARYRMSDDAGKWTA